MWSVFFLYDADWISSPKQPFNTLLNINVYVVVVVAASSSSSNNTVYSFLLIADDFRMKT